MNTLVVNLGASCYATPHRKFFHDYVLGDFGHVLLGDDQPCKIVGMGKAQAKWNNGNEWLLKTCKAYSYYKKNLISTRNLGDSCFFSPFGRTRWKITKGAVIIEKWYRVGTMYLCPHNTNYSIFVASIEVGCRILES